MRGTDEETGSLFGHVDPGGRIPARRPLRNIRQVVNDTLASRDGEFERRCATDGRPSIAPERRIPAGLIHTLFSIRSERQLIEQMRYKVLLRWFVGLGIDDPVWVPTVFRMRRDRLPTTDMSRRVMVATLAHRAVAPLLSDGHFSADGTLVKARASIRRFQPKAAAALPDDEVPGDPPSCAAADHPPAEADPRTDPMPRSNRQNRNTEIDFRGEKCSNATHASTTDPDAPPHRRSPCAGAVLPFMGHAPMENRTGLIVKGGLTRADGHAERQAALGIIHTHAPGSTQRLTHGADRGCDRASFVRNLGQACLTPHVG